MENLPEGVPVWVVIVTGLITAIVTIVTSYMINIGSKKLDVKEELLKSKIDSSLESYEQIKLDLHKALASIKDLKIVIASKDKAIDQVVQKFEAVKLAFRIIYNQYARMFKDDPEQLEMLEELSQIIED